MRGVSGTSSRSSAALARLEEHLDQTRGAIHAQWVLDDDRGSLGVPRRELLAVREERETAAERRGADMLRLIAELGGRRAADNAGVQHGRDFEQLVLEEVSRRAAALRAGRNLELRDGRRVGGTR